MRKVLASMMIVALAQVQAQATTYIWLSPIGSVGAGVTPGVPAVQANGSGELYVWAQLAEKKTLANVTLNVQATTPGVIDFTGVSVLNPVLSQTTGGKDIVRFEYVQDSSVEPPFLVEPAQDPERIDGYGGYTVFNLDQQGAGLGPNSKTIDPWYDADADAWLIGTVSYDTVGPADATTDVFLQIGEKGLNYSGGSSSQVFVVFGDPADPSLNGDSNRGVNSATPDAVLTVAVPEPATLALAVLALLGLAACRFHSRRKGS